MKSKLNITEVLLFGLGIMLTITSNAQNPNNEYFVNAGLMSVGTEGVVGIGYDFSNEESASVVTDGTIYYYRNFSNDGTYDITINKKNSKTIFTRIDEEYGTQELTGNGVSNFHDVVFDNEQNTIAFDLKNNIDIHGEANFKQGIVKVDSTENARTQLSKGMVSFLNGSTVKNVSDKSHVEGVVEKIGNQDFTFPKGDEGYYRPAIITSARNESDVFTGKYTLNDYAFFRARSTAAGVINKLDNKEYWIIEKGSNNSSDIILTLSWDDRTTPSELLTNPERDLRIVRWDTKLQLWVDEGGIVDVSNKLITTPTTVKGYGFFTLATVKTDWLIEGDVVIYNLVSKNDDSKNDYFLIDNIYKFPNNTVQIFNRWGVKVYETTNYDSTGNGTTNVFRGYSEGRGTIAKKEPLPTGTYYYVVSYEYKDASGTRMIKKTGYLHLDTQ
ncbi:MULTISPECIES: gliding motility-associated C-terminal domain-containing protein [Myroides]|uniref:gliding motility-associated C-terminal domain-containing protein n=1 Tax=Myroides TaxID=76831 RepID=UPI001303E984|nr:gliding motility-associated C-terminal domain-containing protein [Myroides phaeus]